MQMMTITGQGLRWMAALVLVLWGCIVAEDSVVKRARRETVMVLVELRHLRNGQQPVKVSQPLLAPRSVERPAIG